MSDHCALLARERCLTCAYRSGTKASASKSTQLTAQLCALSGEPFYCHEEMIPLGADDSARTVVCAGHEAAVLALGDIPDWQCALAASMLAQICGTCYDPLGEAPDLRFSERVARHAVRAASPIAAYLSRPFAPLRARSSDLGSDDRSHQPTQRGQTRSGPQAAGGVVARP